MYANFVICLRAVLPVFMMILIGMGVKKIGWLTTEEVKKFNKFTFNMFFPPMMFRNVWESDMSKGMSWGFVFFCVFTIVATALISSLVFRRIEKDPRTVAVMVQASFRSNFVLMGLPIVTNLFGQARMGEIAAVLVVVVPVFNVAAVVVLETFRGGTIDVRSILKGVLTNPIIDGTIAGFLFVALHIPLHPMLRGVINDMADVASPLALIILGASISFQSVRAEKRQLVITVLTRLLIVPAVWTAIAVPLGIRGIHFATLTVMLCGPAAVSSFTMAQAMDCDGELAGNTVVFTSALSVGTIVLWLFFYKNLGMF